MIMRQFCVLLLLVLIACAPAEMPVARVEKSLAVLAVHSGEVLVNGSPASAGQDVKEGDVVKTLAGKASVVFFDSSVLRLDENTEVSVQKISKDAVELGQTAGQTWSRVLKVSGIKEYRIETPNTVATVRGTGFAVSVYDGDTKIVVKEGEVQVASYEDEQVVAEAIVSEDMVLEISDEMPEELELEAVEADEWVEENIVEDEQFIDEVVEEYVEEHPEIVEEMGEEQAEQKVEEYVTGEAEELVPEEMIIEEAEVETMPGIVEPVHEDAAETIEETVAEEKVVEPQEETVAEEQVVDKPAEETYPKEYNSPPEINI